MKNAKEFRKRYECEYVVKSNILLGIKKSNINTTAKFMTEVGKGIVGVNLFKIRSVGDMFILMRVVYDYFKIDILRPKSVHHPLISDICKRKDVMALLASGNHIGDKEPSSINTVIHSMAFMEESGMNQYFESLSMEYYTDVFMPYILGEYVYVDESVRRCDSKVVNERSVYMLQYINRIDTKGKDVRVDSMCNNLWNLIDSYWIPLVGKYFPDTMDNETLRLKYISNTTNEIMFNVSHVVETSKLLRINEDLILSNSGMYVKFEVFVYKLVKSMWDDLPEDDTEVDIPMDTLHVLMNEGARLIYVGILHIYRYILTSHVPTDTYGVYDNVRRIIESNKLSD